MLVAKAGWPATRLAAVSHRPGDESSGLPCAASCCRQDILASATRDCSEEVRGFSTLPSNMPTCNGKRGSRPDQFCKNQPRSPGDVRRHRRPLQPLPKPHAFAVSRKAQRKGGQGEGRKRRETAGNLSHRSGGEVLPSFVCRSPCARSPCDEVMFYRWDLFCHLVRKKRPYRLCWGPINDSIVNDPFLTRLADDAFRCLFLMLPRCRVCTRCGCYGAAGY